MIQFCFLMALFLCSEKPRDTEWLSLNDTKVAILVNYSQCQLVNKEYYSVIEHCSTALEYQPGMFYIGQLQSMPACE